MAFLKIGMTHERVAADLREAVVSMNEVLVLMFLDLIFYLIFFEGWDFRWKSPSYAEKSKIQQCNFGYYGN